MTNYDRAIYGAAWALILSGIIVILGLAIHPVAASAAVNWRERTCQAAAAYQQHPAAGRLATLVTGSTHLGRGWLKADVLEAAATISSPSKKAVKYAARDLAYVASDCA